MAFIDYRLSDKVSQGFTGGPKWDTTVIPNLGGYEARVANQAAPLWQLNADYGGFPSAEQNLIYVAHLAARGMRDSFRVKDWHDFKATDQALGTGDGTATARQLRKFYTFGPVTFTRDIILPIADTLVVTDNGSPFAVTLQDDGMVVPAVGNWISGHIYKATFQFDLRMRFASDYYPFNMPAKNLTSVSIDLIEARTP